MIRRSEYTLVRLEFADRHPGHPAPPILDRLPDASERSLREHWARVERQLETILAFVRDFEAAGGRGQAPDGTFRTLARNVKELDQYARALRWVLTVTERDPPEA
jgi:hypothetical protein